ncbi:MAG: sensor histidine kinase [Elusimicrobiota bacterium]
MRKEDIVKDKWLVSQLASLVGIEGAEKTISAVVEESGFSRSSTYTHPQLKKICDILERKGGNLKLFSMIIQNELFREKSYKKEYEEEKKERQKLEDYLNEIKSLNKKLNEKNRQIEESYTKQAQMQDQMIRNEKLAMVGKMAGAVGHEIRTPLSSIKNAAFYLSRYGRIEDEESKSYLDIMSQEINTAEEIVGSLLEFSKTGYLDKSQVFPGEIIDEVLERLNTGENIKIKKEIDDKDFSIQADPNKLKRLFYNIIKNAVQAVEGEGIIEIKGKSENGDKSIKISDNGEGMDEKTLKHIFEPLYTTKASGVGLGLSIVKDIAEKHGWKIKAESHRGSGTEITLEIKE